MSKHLSWNRLPRILPQCVRPLTCRGQALPSIARAPRPLLAQGNARSYGDVCLTQRGTLLPTRALDRFIYFDPTSGIIRCEAGVTLAELLAMVVPQGWFLPVTPGTQFVTLGGAVANDVHGKNHHSAGTFGHHVRCFELVRSDGENIECRPASSTPWFGATVGGLGLTGLISWVELQLISIKNAWMWVESQRFGSLEEFWELNRLAELDWPYTVAWVDCLAKGKARGRGILLRGQHAPTQLELPTFRARRRSMPVDPPFSLVSNLSLKLFNSLYYRRRLKARAQISHYVPFFYPLDNLENWNRIYGRRGFYQYQCVLPPSAAKDATAALLDVIAGSGQGSFLAVLKTFGSKSSLGMLSFPRPGTTLALDFPNRGKETETLFQQLDSIVASAGGALYPAKDARMPAEMFRSGYPAWEEFSRYIDPAFSSNFWERVSA